MASESPTVLSVSSVVSVPAEQLFAVLVDPARHSEIDGSGMIRGAVTTEQIGQVGDIFTMDMEQPAFGSYKSDNHVVEFEPGQKIAWAPGGSGQPPLGHVWAWEFVPEGGSTLVKHTYDWSGVTDERLLAALKFPRVSADQMATTIDRLAKAAT